MVSNINIDWHERFLQQAAWTFNIREYLIDRIDLDPSSRILEIGCGTGLLLSRIAPHCAYYLGTDFSIEAINYTSHLKEQVQALAHVDLEQRLADNFNNLQKDSVDTIISEAW